MFEIAFRNYRGFHNLNFVPIAPITLLVGENSAGKSSFLAGLKYLLDFVSGEGGEPSFNRDPFQLGTFQQISHFRGGKAGRARQFSLFLRGRVTPVADPALEPELTQVELTFDDLDSQAVVREIIVSVRRESLIVTFGDGISTYYVAPNRTRSAIDDRSRMIRIGRSDVARYWPFLLQELTYRLRRGRDQPEQALLDNSDPGLRSAVLSSYAEALSRSVRSHVEATSAIRTKPQRTYTPGAEIRSGEGTHVPYEMAQMYRSKKEDWRNLKGQIDAFGRQSEMFEEVHIKSFGQTVSDPFQIQFSKDGPRTNLVDLGYGTSQVLPLLHDVTTAAEGTRFLVQQPEVHLHPRAQAALGTFFVDAFRLRRSEFVLETHSDFIVDRIRLAIANGSIDVDDVSLIFLQRQRLENRISIVRLSDEGEAINPPKPYREFFVDEQLRVLGVS